MRHLYKSWQNRRPGFTRRVRWYQRDKPIGYAGEGVIRLCFEDDHGIVNMYYSEADTAQPDYDAFRDGNLSVMMLWKQREGKW